MNKDGGPPMSRSRDLERQGKKDRDFVDFVDFIDLESGSENKQINPLFHPHISQSCAIPYHKTKWVYLYSILVVWKEGGDLLLRENILDLFCNSGFQNFNSKTSSYCFPCILVCDKVLKKWYYTINVQNEYETQENVHLILFILTSR